MLGVYLATLPEHGGAEVDAPRPSVSSRATFYLAELVALAGLRRPLGPARSPPGDAVRPDLRCVAVVLTGLTTNLVAAGWDAPPRGCVDRRERPLDPRLHRARDRRQRGPARQGRGALRGSDARRASAPGSSSRRSCSRRSARRPSSSMPSCTALVPDLPVRRDGPDPASRAAVAAGRTRGPAPLRRRSSRISHVWLLAPTWIAVNAAIGLWFSQSLFQFSKADPRSPTSS